jgi:hypothetical protein
LYRVLARLARQLSFGRISEATPRRYDDRAAQDLLRAYDEHTRGAAVGREPWARPSGVSFLACATALSAT